MAIARIWPGGVTELPASMSSAGARTASQCDQKSRVPHTSRWIEIAAEWGTRDYWQQWRAVRAPALLIEAGISVAPPGQILAMTEKDCPTTYLHVPEAGHLVHDEAPQVYRQAVESFLASC